MRDALLALLCVAVGGCSYDWTVGAGAPDAGNDAVVADGAAGIDGTADGPADTSSPPPDDASTPDVAEAATLPPCMASQQAPLEQDRAAALVCTGVTPMPCEVSLTDECGCPVIVAAFNQAEGTYAAALQALEKACVPTWCPTGCGAAPTKGLCILGDAGAGVLACSQQ